MILRSEPAVFNQSNNIFIADSIDDLIHDVFEALLARPFDISTSRGKTSELLITTIQLNNPLARLSRSQTRGKPFSALGELMWYLAKTNELEFIEFYISAYSKDSFDNKTIHGGYGPRLFRFRKNKINQVKNVIDLLKTRKFSRKAVIQLFDAADLDGNHKEFPCTCTLQFFIRNGKLDMLTSMRSNDAFLGLPHDIFTFTMIQEIIARSLNTDLGTYYHTVGSLHMYERHKIKAQQYLAEGFQSTKNSMPPMPYGDPWPAIERLVNIESKIRRNKKHEELCTTLDPYWVDLIRLLEIHAYLKRKQIKSFNASRSKLSNPIYNAYIDSKQVKK